MPHYQPFNYAMCHKVQLGSVKARNKQSDDQTDFKRIINFSGNTLSLMSVHYL